MTAGPDSYSSSEQGERTLTGERFHGKVTMIKPRLTEHLHVRQALLKAFICINSILHNNPIR